MKTLVCFGFVLCAMSAAGTLIVKKPGQTVVLQCPVSIFTTSVEWKHEDNLIAGSYTRGFPRRVTSDIGSRSRISGKTNLSVRGVKEEDAGKFTWVVDGKSQDITLVVVSVSASPSADPQLGSNATLQCRVRGVKPDPKVQWKGPDGNLRSESEVQLTSVAPSDAGTWECTFTHAEGTHTETLEIKVQRPPTTLAPAPAPVPSQKSKTCPKCVTIPPPKADRLLGLSWWLWVIVGVGCLVAVLLLVVVICFYKRIKRKKRRLLKMKNSRLPLTSNQYCQCNRPTAAAKPQQGRRREKPSAPPLQPLLME
ncbi:CD4-2 molecule, tandem duplicate 1 [Symphorus nematophorus]